MKRALNLETDSGRTRNLEIDSERTRHLEIDRKRTRNLWLKTVRYLAVLVALSLFCGEIASGHRAGTYTQREKAKRRGAMPGVLRLTEADQGIRRSAVVGQEVAVELAETPSSGYRWWLDAVPPTAVHIVGTDWKATGKGGVGAAGDRTFSLVLKAAGEVRLELKLWRAWQGEDSAVARHEFIVEVGQAGKE